MIRVFVWFARYVEAFPPPPVFSDHKRRGVVWVDQRAGGGGGVGHTKMIDETRMLSLVKGSVPVVSNLEGIGNRRY